MKLFVDTGNIKDIEALALIGIIDGVTTNPSLLAKEPGDYRENLKKICRIVQGPVSGEVVSTDFAGMMREGHDIAALDEHDRGCRSPATASAPVRSRRKAFANVTLVFQQPRRLAAKAGASPSSLRRPSDDAATNGWS
jgi:transaldolase